MNRRSILMLVAGGFAGIMSRSARAKSSDRMDTPGQRSRVSASSDLRDDPDQGTVTLLDLKRLGPDQQVRSIRHRDGAYRVATADGKNTTFSEHDLRFRVDSSEIGPIRGRPVILPAGPVGDRAWVFFSSPREIGTFIGAHNTTG